MLRLAELHALEPGVHARRGCRCCRPRSARSRRARPCRRPAAASRGRAARSRPRGSGAPRRSGRSAPPARAGGRSPSCTSSSLTLGPLAVTRRPFQSGSSTSGSVSNTALKLIGWPSSSLTSSTCGRRERLEAAPVELVEDDLVDDGLGGLAQDLVLEALLDHVERHLARAEAGNLHAPGELPGAGVDRLLDLLRLDLEGERLPDRTFLDVVDFQGGLPQRGNEGQRRQRATSLRSLQNTTVARTRNDAGIGQGLTGRVVRRGKLARPTREWRNWQTRTP